MACPRANLALPLAIAACLAIGCARSDAPEDASSEESIVASPDPLLAGRMEITGTKAIRLHEAMKTVDLPRTALGDEIRTTATFIRCSYSYGALGERGGLEISGRCRVRAHEGSPIEVRRFDSPYQAFDAAASAPLLHAIWTLDRLTVGGSGDAFEHYIDEVTCVVPTGANAAPERARCQFLDPNRSAPHG